MKKVLTFILSLIFIISLCACEGEKTNDENPPSNPPNNSTPTDNQDNTDEYPEDLAQIVIDYENGVKEGLEIMRAEHPEYEYFYNPVKAVECI